MTEKEVRQLMAQGEGHATSEHLYQMFQESGKLVYERTPMRNAPADVLNVQKLTLSGG